MVHTYKRLGELLVGRGAITNLQLSIALADQRISNKRLGEIVVERGYVTEHEIASCLSHQYGYPLDELKDFKADAAAIQKLSPEDALALRALPIKLTPEGIVVGISDPIDVLATDKLAALLRCNLIFRVCPQSKLSQCIRQVYELDEPLPAKFAGASKAPTRFKALVPRHYFANTTLLDGFDSTLDRHVNLVVTKAECDEEVEFLQILRSASKAPLEGLASVYDSIVHGGYRWTVLQKLPGEHLERVLRIRGPRGIAQSAELVAKVAETADQLQRYGGCVHWICAENIMVRRDGPLLAPLSLPPAKYKRPSENFDAEQPGSLAVYALGMLLRDCLYGLDPRFSPALPSAMKDMLEHCLADDPKDRYSDPIEVASALKSYNWAALANPLAHGTNDERQELLDILGHAKKEDIPAKETSFWSRIFKRKAA